MQIQRMRNVCIIGGGIILFLIGSSTLINHYQHDHTKSSNIMKSVNNTEEKVEKIIFWKNATFREEYIPLSVVEASNKVDINQDTIDILGIKTFYQVADPPSGVSKSGAIVVLLHGAIFTSEIWVELGTIRLLAAMGHKVFAIDLPGYGKTPRSSIPDKSKFLHTFLEELRIQDIFLISPAMSGCYSIPYLLEHPDNLTGYIPIAPVDAEVLRDEPTENIKVPILFIGGEMDFPLYQYPYKAMKNIPTFACATMKDTQHPGYKYNTPLFHQLLYNFIKKVHAAGMH